MERRVKIQWTETARSQLAKLDPKVRKGILAKAALLRDSDDPRSAHKPLAGPLRDYYRLTYGRYRAIYAVEEEDLASGDSLIHVRVLFVAAGKRKEHDKRDIYKIAQRIVEAGLIDPDELGQDDED